MRILLLIFILLLSLATPVMAQDSLFAPAVNYPLSHSPVSLCAADLNGDSSLDIAAAVVLYNPIVILFNDGYGTFGSPFGQHAAVNQKSICSADFNGDGRVDLAVAADSTIAILINNGDSTFQQSYISNPHYYTSIFPADLNNDGYVDLAATMTSGISIFINNGDGTFQNEVTYGGGAMPSSVFAADFDGDGFEDLSVANYYSGVFVLRNNGDGTFAPGTVYGEGHHPRYLCAADFNGDGHNDLAVAMNQGVSIFTNDGNGGFSNEYNYPGYNNPNSIVAADFNLDGHEDLAVSNGFPDSISIIINNGDGTLASPVNYAAGTGPCSIVAGDFDGDGDSDLAVANLNSNNVSILINQIVPTGTGNERIRPDKFYISQNFPNPFNSQTSIRYSISKAGPAKLTIYNLLGQKITTLYDGNQPAGEHSIIWNASDFTSGIYFGKLQSGGETRNIKMMLLK